MSFRLKTILGIALIETLLLFILIISGINFLIDSNEAQLRHRAETTSRLFANAVKDALLTTDLATLASFVEESLNNPDIVYIRITSNGASLAEAGDRAILQQIRAPDRHLSDVDDGVFDVVAKVEEGGIPFGEIALGLSTSNIDQTLAMAKRWTISIATLEVTLVAIFSFVLGTYLTRQLQRLKSGTEIIEQSGPGHQISINGKDELAEVARAFNVMSSTLQQSYTELQDSLSSEKRMVAIAKHNEAKNKAILSTSLDAMVTIDADGHVIDFNQVAEEIFGWRLSEIAGKPMVDFIIPQHMRAAHLKGMQRYIATGNSDILGRRLKLTALRKGGHEFPIEISISPLATDQGPMFTAFIRDISEQIAAETELRLAAQAFESSEAMFITDADIKIIRTNSAFTRITGYANEDVLGKNPGSVLRSGIHEADFYQRMWASLQDNGEWSGEIYNKRKNGEIFPEYLNISEVTDSSGETTHYVAHFVDITEQKRNEEYLSQARQDAEAANQAKSRFLAAMSHEIRTPMNAVLGIFGLLRDAPLTNHQQRLVQTGRESGELLLSIINDILDFSKMEAGKLQLEHSGFDLHRLFALTVELLRSQAEHKGLSLILFLDHDLPRYAKGDPDRLRQILLNLVNNAVKFTSSGHINIRVSADSPDDERVSLHCSVEDSGIGIPEGLHASLFEEFSMADQSHSRSYEGTGLGLAICKRLVTLMQGSIDFSSKQGIGSTFNFTVELKTATGEEVENLSNQDESGQFPDSKTRILLAEDNPANQMVIKSILEYNGLKAVDIVANGREALEAIRSLPYDIILMDISMPEMDGMETTREIRQLPGAAAQTPIVALTAHALAGDRERFIAAGMNDYLTKPIDRVAMLRCIARWTDGAENRRKEPPDAVVDSDTELADNQDEYVDEAVLQQLVRDTAPDITVTLLHGYIDDARRLVTQIEQALAEGDMEQLEFASHTLGSSAGAHGNIRLHKLARNIEHHCREADHEQALSLAGSLPTLAMESFGLLEQRAEKGFVTTDQ